VAIGVVVAQGVVHGTSNVTRMSRANASFRTAAVAAPGTWVAADVGADGGRAPAHGGACGRDAGASAGDGGGGSKRPRVSPGTARVELAYVGAKLLAEHEALQVALQRRWKHVPTGRAASGGGPGRERSEPASGTAW
jgi:hypothetical protein